MNNPNPQNTLAKWNSVAWGRTLSRAFLSVACLAAALSGTVGRAAGVPAISNIAPVSGVVGAPIVVSGTNFSPTASANLVYFGAVQAAVLAASSSNVTVAVPPGATFGPITVTVGGLTASSGQFFEPRYINTNDTAITANSFVPGFDLGTATNPGDTIIADFDGDGKPDVAVVCGGGDVLSIYRNLGANGAPLGAASFAPPVNLTFPTNGTGGNPYRLRAVDLDGDGKLDLIAAEVGGNRVSVFHNLSTPGNLSFEAPFALIVGNDCRSVVAGDLDGDGHPDIVALNYGDKTISLLKNVNSTPGVLNAGSFVPAGTLAAPGGPYEAVIADLNGDGKPDLAVAESDGGTVTVFQNAGGILSSNTFPAGFDLPCGSATASLAAVDLDGDGRLDLVAGSVQSEVISVFRNVNSGGALSTNSFAARVDFGTGNWVHTIAIADFDGDGRPDIAVVGELPSLMSIFQNVSTPGSFTAASLAPRVDFATGWNAWGIAAGDLNGDGEPDIVFGNDYDATIEIYQNQAPVGQPPVAGPPVITAINPVLDVPGGGVTISGKNFSSTASANIVYFGAVQAAVTAASPGSLTVTVPTGALYQPVSVTVGGLTAASGPYFEPTFAGSGTINASNFPASFNLPVGDTPGSPVIGDLDGDGHPDLVVASYGDDTILVYRNIGTNNVLSAATFAAPVVLSMAGNPVGVVLADVDGDGRLDIVACDNQNNQVSIFRNLSAPGSLTTNSFAARVDFPVGQQPFGLAVADLNGDGLPDIVTANTTDSTISLLQNTGAAGGITANTFAAHVDIASGDAPECLAVGDLDGDGSPDIVTANIGGNSVSIFRNLAGGGNLTTNSFAPRVDLTGTGGGEGVAIGDVDGDGKPDLLLTGYLPQTLSLFQNLSTPGNLTAASFGPRIDFATGGRAHRVTLSDLDGDGKLDITVTTELPSQLLIFKNLSSPGTLGSASLAAPVVFATGWNPSGTAIGDLDGDGRPDIIVANSYDANVSIYQNATAFGSLTGPPIILGQPANVTAIAGNTATFTVTANGTAPLSYQWSFDGTNLLNATNATLTLDDVQLAQAGNYSVLVTNEVGSILSSNALLTVLPPVPPAILSQSPGALVAVGSTVTFGVTASGSMPLSYQWSQNGTPIPNATNSSYTLFNAPLTDTGSYFSCLVTNAYGSAASSNVTLKVIDVVANGLCNGAILITNASYTNAQSTLKADAPGNPAPDCVDGFGHGVWYEIYSPVAGSLEVDTFGSDYDTGLGLYTGSCGAMTEVACNDDAVGTQTSQIITPTTAATTYYILAGGYGSDAGNLVLHVNYLTPPIFEVEPTNLLVVVSSNAVFSPTVMGTQPISFQWYFNNAPLTDGGRISGAASAALTIADINTNDGGSYQLVASNSIGVTTSSVAVLTPVILPPTFMQAPSNLAVGQGSNANFFAVIGGTPPFGYQWSFNGNPLTDDGVHVAGSQTSSLNISNLTTADAGGYSLTVTNVSGSVSASATLTVLTPPAFTLEPVGRSVPPGLPTTFTIATSGIPGPALQWQLNGTNIPNATGISYSLAAVGTNNLGVYTVVASNLMGTVVSSPGQLTFGPVGAWGLNLLNNCLPPPGLSNVIQVAGTETASYAVRADGSVAAWGSQGTNLNLGVTNVVSIAASPNENNYALRADGTVVGLTPLADTLPSNLSNIVQLAASIEGNLALRADGLVYAGGGYPIYPGQAGLSHVKGIAVGATEGLALRTDGTVVAWGNGPGTNVPAGLANVAAIAAGSSQCLALLSNATVVAWGSGTGTNVPAGLTNVVAIYAGGSNLPGGGPASESLSIAVLANGKIVEWGDDYYGETNAPAALTNLFTVAAAAANDRSLVLVNDGRPLILQPPVGLTADSGRSVTLQATVAGSAPLSYQWLLNGTNVAGATNVSLVMPVIQAVNAGSYQLFVSNSISTALSLPAPVNVVTNYYILQFASQTAAAATNVYQGGKVALYAGTVVGNGPLTYQWYFSPTNWSPFYPAYPQSYVPLAGATNDTLTLNPALAMQSGNYCVAVSNQYSTIVSAPVPVHVLFEKAWGPFATDASYVLTNAMAVAVDNYGPGSDQGAYLALSSAGKILSWANYYGPYTETNFASLSNSIVTAIAAGYGDTLALKSDGTVFALGSTYNSEWGVTNVPGAANGITAIACGDYHDLALRYDGTVVGWGQNTYGQTTNTNATNIVAIAAGGGNSIGLRADGSVTTWGNYGAARGWPLPYNVTNIVAVAAGGEHFLALNAHGTVVGWGANTFGQTTIPANWTNIVAIAAGANHSTALRNDGTVVTIGSASSASMSNYIPSDLANVTAIASGADRDVALFGTRAPAITVQPWNRTVANTTTSVWFAAKCVGVQPIRYQWKLNGTNLPGATNDLLNVYATIGGPPIRGPIILSPLQSGVYQLVASNAYGMVASHYVQLEVVIPLGVALNATNQSWSTSGDALWYGETNITHDGVSAAQSGSIAPFQDTILQTTIATNVAGNYTFWWKVSSEPDFDFLEFRINGIVQASISGEVDWQPVNIPVSPGTNVLLWHYYKDSIYNSGLDAGWVDQFAFAPAPLISKQPSNVTAYAGSSAVFGIYAESNVPGQNLNVGFQWQKNGVNLANGPHISGATSEDLTIYNVQDADAAVYTVVVTNSAGGSVVSQPATLTVLDSPPVIIEQPASSTNYAGTTATFVVGEHGALPMQWQWQKNGVNLAGANSDILILPNVQDADAASYTVIITNAYGSVTSAPAILAVADGPPVITVQPANLSVLRGQTASLAVAANGTAPISYQWQHAGTNIVGATNASLALTPAGFANRGAYQVLAANSYGKTASAMAMLNVVRSRIVAWGDNTYGEINVPTSLSDVVAVAAGAYHGLALQADGTVAAWGDDSYGETNVPPGLNDIIAIAGGGYDSMALRVDGSIFAWGANDAGQTNVPAGLTDPVAIAAGGENGLALQADGTVAAWGDDSYGETNVPTGLTNVVAVAAGEYYSMALQAGGTIMAWGNNQQYSTSVPGGLSNVVTAIAAHEFFSAALKTNGTVTDWGSSSTPAPADLTNAMAVAIGAFHGLALRADGTVEAWGDNYYGQATVPIGLTNAVAIGAGDNYSMAIASDGSPFVTKQPVSQLAVSNATVQFTATVLGVPPFAYQWQKNGVNLTDGVKVSGSRTATLTLSNVQTADMASYTVVVTNGIDSTTSLPATLLVAGPPAILLQPASQTVNYGANPQFNVLAVGYPPPAYAWWWNGTNQVGGNSPTLALTGVARAQDGIYSVVVTNANGGVLSSNAVLTVLVPQLISSPVLLPGGGLQLTSTDLGGGALTPSDLPNFQLQVSTNLVDWTAVPNALSLTNGTLTWQDNAWNKYTQRFYRIVEQ